MQIRFAAAAAIFLLALSTWVAWREIMPFAEGGGSRGAQYQAVADGRVHAGLSTFSQYMVLSGCAEAMTSVYGRFQDAQRRKAVIDNCSKEARSVTAWAPSQSYAWFVRALAAIQDGDAEGMNAALQRSRTTGPFEQWIAQLRVALGEDHREALDAGNRSGNDRDLAMLVQSEIGVRSIARRYIAVPAFRQRITALVDTLPENVQQTFVAKVRNAAREMGLI